MATGHPYRDEILALLGSPSVSDARPSLDPVTVPSTPLPLPSPLGDALWTLVCTRHQLEDMVHELEQVGNSVRAGTRGVRRMGRNAWVEIAGDYGRGRGLRVHNDGVRRGFRTHFLRSRYRLTTGQRVCPGHGAPHSAVLLGPHMSVAGLHR